MKRFAKFTLGIFVLATVALAFDYWSVTRKERLLSRAVTEIGGRIGSIPVWPLGTEYRITLTAVPNSLQLEKLRTANQMRGWVGIAFEDCNLSQDDIDRFHLDLAACHLFVVRNGKTTTLPRAKHKSEQIKDSASLF